MFINQKILLLVITLIFSFYANADTITVKQDNTGDYTIIQEAINASVDGDTIVVWPGTYYENVDFAGHSITLASRVLTTGDLSYSYSTIIDGNGSGSCVKIMEGEDASVVGFTLQNGTGSLIGTNYYGGGIAIFESSCIIKDCVIKNNLAQMGGGGIAIIFCNNVFISGTSVFNNQSYFTGGGIAIGYSENTVFDSISHCNIYRNYAMYGCDLHKSSPDTPLDLYLDTCTVLNSDWYFISSIDEHGYQIDDIDINIQNGWLSPVDADLYVNPITGNNSNSGLSPDNALQSIAFAYSLIYPDSTDKNTIHLANGVYSDSTNNEKFPLNIRGYVDVTGESMENTILDGRYKTPLMRGNNDVSFFSFKKMTMQRGGNIEYDDFGLLSLYINNSNVVFDSIIFQKAHQKTSSSAFELSVSNKTEISNCIFRQNIGGRALRTMSQEGDTLIIKNCKFYDSKIDYSQPDSYSLALQMHGGGNSLVSVIGCLFYNNDDWNITVTGTSYDLSINFINCTFSKNTILSNKYSFPIMDANVSLYNCISFEQGGNPPFYQTWYAFQDYYNITIKNSLIENGEDDIYTEAPYCSYTYDSTNIEGDPLFYYGPDFPYNLSNNSPCIDAGTMDIPDWIELPEYDLAGNPRIYGDNIDMGCYEWNPTVGVPDNTVAPKEKLLSLAPNPASSSTMITVNSSGANRLKLEAYNNSGQRIAVIVDSHIEKGTYTTTWNLNSNNSPLSPGIYHIILIEDGIEKDAVKLVVR